MSMSLVAGDYQFISISKGTWQYWFHDKETLEPFTGKQVIEINEDCQGYPFRIPDLLVENKNAVLKIERILL